MKKHQDNFVINHTPIPASRPRVTRYATFYTKSYTKYRKLIYPLVKSMRIQKEKGAVQIDIVFYMPIPKSWNDVLRTMYGSGVENNMKSIRKNQKSIFENKYCPTGADVDNLAKALLDALNGIAFDDDSQVAIINIQKRYSNNPRTEFKIKEVNND